MSNNTKTETVFHGARAWHMKRVIAYRKIAEQCLADGETENYVYWNRKANELANG